jgi:hypothetical protein
VIGFELDVLHVCRAGTDVFSRDVAATKGLDKSAVSPEHGLAVDSFVVTDDD